MQGSLQAQVSPSTMGLFSGPGTTLKAQCFMSLWTRGSWNLRPIRRLMSCTVFLGLMAACSRCNYQ